MEHKEAIAKIKRIRITPRKMRYAADLIRGKRVDEAFKILRFIPRKSARILSKLLKSAAANAENNHEMDVDRLFISKICVDDGPTWRRIQPRSMGRAYLILKRTSHTTLTLGELPEELIKAKPEEDKPKKKRATRKKKAEPKAEKTEVKTEAKAEEKVSEKPKAKKTTAKKTASKKTEAKGESKATAKKEKAEDKPAKPKKTAKKADAEKAESVKPEKEDKKTDKEATSGTES